uniref:Uncharacterized protein n=2 Tax=Rhizophagus irregularis (strain DAOM 181602 / DAOM 197198 / MUCL 43194) TaxID=747089 RepID=U9TXF5_RHIID
MYHRLYPKSYLFDILNFYQQSLLFFFDFANAFNVKDNDGDNNPVIEAVFDLMITVLIPLILFTDNENLKEIKLFELISEGHLKLIKRLPIITMNSLLIWFCVIKYQNTQDFFFIVYLITKLLYNYIKNITDYITSMLLLLKWFNFIVSSKSLYISFLLIYVLNNAIDFIFISLAVKRNYVDKTNLSFALVPIIIVFFIGVLIFICNVCLEDNATSKDKEDKEAQKASKDEETSNDVDALNIVVVSYEKAPKDEEALKAENEEFKRQRWISVFCGSLITCTIVGPSVLWIKSYIILGFIAYMIEELLKKLKKRKVGEAK